MKRDGILEASICQRFFDLADTLNERQRRLWAASEARALGYGGVSLVAKATGVSRRAIRAALTELATATSGVRRCRSCCTRWATACRVTARTKGIT